MGLGFRIFLFDDNDCLHRLSMKRYNRLFRSEPEERLPQYAGKRVRCALVVLEVVERKPVSIARVEYSIITFDNEGRIDVSEREKQMRIAGELFSFAFDKQSSEKIIDAKSHFARKRYEQEFKWRPSPAIEEAIVNAIFGPV